MQQVLTRYGITHKQVADRAGQERSYVTRQLRGERPVTDSVASAIDELIRDTEAHHLRRAARLLDRDGAPEAADRARLLAVG